MTGRRPYAIVRVYADGRQVLGADFPTSERARVAALKALLDETVDHVDILTNGHRSRTITRDDPDATTEIADPQSIAELVETWQRTEADIRAGFGIVANAMEQINGAVSMGERHLYLQASGGYRGDTVKWSDPDEPLRELRRAVWQAIVERSQVRKAMSMDAWKKLEEEMAKGEPPDLTIENVEGVLANFRAEAPSMLKAAVDEVFEMLRPHPGGWRGTFKVNSEYAVGERVVLSGYVSRGFGRNWAVNHYRSQDMIALENVFYMLDGRVRDAADGYYSKLQTAIESCPLSGSCQGETEFFAFKGFARTTLHIRFKRPDLVRKLNVIAGGKRLKPEAVA